MSTYEPLIDLAVGGMGTVAIARRIGAAGFERIVVTKRVHPRLCADPSYRRMIRDEALLLARVHDAHVVPILDVVDDDGELTLVLEYVESMSLAELLAAARARGSTPCRRSSVSRSSCASSTISRSRRSRSSPIRAKTARRRASTTV